LKIVSKLTKWCTLGVQMTDTIFGKAFDFSSLTIRHLKKRGRLDADIQLGLYQALKEVKDGTADSEAVKRMLKRAKLSANREGKMG
jgi:hypothetical protein